MHTKPEHLRAWRESLGLSRQTVVDRLASLSGYGPIDQAALGKWESGETAVRYEDLVALASIYETTPDRLFFEPGDKRTPDLLQRAHSIITSCDPEAVERWLSMAEMLPKNSAA
jgi:transcriptional regulator with XRE-family HTH domain